MKLRDKIWLDGFYGLSDKDVIKYKDIGRSHFESGFDACEAQYLQIIEKLESALKFYSLKSNYSLVDEGRNYHSDYKCYELNEISYADEELGTRAKESLAELEQFKKKMNGEK